MGNSVAWMGAFALGCYQVIAHPVIRKLPVVAIGLWFVWVLIGQIGAVDTDLLVAILADIPVTNWVGALMAAGISFVGVAAYDVVLARTCGVYCPVFQLLNTGFVATALAQLIGLGLATGSLVRWRMLGPENFTLLQGSMLTLAVTSGFVAAAAFLIATSSLIWIELPGLWWLASALVIFAGLFGVFLCVVRPKLFIFGRIAALPKVRTVISVFLLNLVDMGFAALAFWLLMPVDAATSFTILLPVFLLATGVGILSGIPGGVGLFELTCLSLLPSLGDAPVLATLLAFRIVYYLLPGLLAAVLLLRREWQGQVVRPLAAPVKSIESGQILRPDLIRLVAKAGRADARLALDGDFGYLTNARRSGFLMVGETGNCLTVLSDPVGEPSAWPDLFLLLDQEAKRRDCIPVLYKCGAKAAELAQQSGLRAYQIGQEAILDPATFTLQGSAKSGLRRKLAQASKAGIRVEMAIPEDLPVQEMRRVSDQWQRRQGGERGFSMGCFGSGDPQLHRFFLAWQGDQLIGFIGLWQTEKETALDLLRTGDGAPTGVMHALVVAAISSLRIEGVRRFSLAAVPFSGLTASRALPERFCNWLYHNRPGLHGGAGLYQFKQGFRPNWEPRFLVTAGPVSAALAGIEIAARIRPQSRFRMG